MYFAALDLDVVVEMLQELHNRILDQIRHAGGTIDLTNWGKVDAMFHSLSEEIRDSARYVLTPKGLEKLHEAEPKAVRHRAVVGLDDRDSFGDDHPDRHSGDVADGDRPSTTTPWDDSGGSEDRS